MNVLRTLAWKNLKRNRKRTIATIIGIVVSVMLISFILTLIYSFQTTMIEDAKSRIGNYHIRIDETTTEIAKLELLFALYYIFFCHYIYF